MVDELTRGRESYRRGAWADAYEMLAQVDRSVPLDVGDLERLAEAAYLIGRDDDYLSLLDRAHHAHLNAGAHVRAARCAFWAGLSLLLRGETARATGWLARAQRLLGQRDCVERGYLQLPVVEQLLAGDDHQAAYEAASEAAAIGERFADSDLIACARHLQGRALLRRGDVEPGLELLDEAMVAVTAGELSPIVTGLVYCSVIEACQHAYAPGRAREWTAALAQWCEQQPQLIAFTTTCLVRRAEILRLHGDWGDAIEEARQACDRFTRGLAAKPPAAAFYQQGEIYRLRGEYEAAEQAYREASRWGLDPQPGLALLWLSQSRSDAAAGAIRRALSGTADRLKRTTLLPAFIEIMLALGDREAARGGCDELEEIAQSFPSPVVGAMAAQARGAVQLEEDDAEAALGSLRDAWEVWHRVEAPHAAARVRVLIGLACRALGDDAGGRLEIDAARAVFEQLGAAPELERIDALTRSEAPAQHGNLTPRELQVLRLVATGRTNKAIATELFLSERTVERHLSNIFNKLDVSTRAAATAYAYRNELI